MSPRIQDLDGLPTGEIKLLVAESEQRIMDSVDLRLAAQDTRMDTIQTDLSVLVGTAKLTGLVQLTKDAIDQLTLRHDTWHEDDVRFRAGVEGRLDTLQTDTSQLAEQVKDIRWFVLLSNGMTWTTTKGVALLRAAEVWKLLVVGAVLYLLHLTMPSVFALVERMIALGK